MVSFCCRRPYNGPHDGSPSMVTTCFSCHNRCMGPVMISCWMPIWRANGEHDQDVLWPNGVWLQGHGDYPVGCECQICLSRSWAEWGLALWSLISLRFIENGLGTAVIGGLYIPGSSSVPKDAEYLPAAFSRSRCSHTKLNVASSREHDEESKSTGHSGWL